MRIHSVYFRKTVMPVSYFQYTSILFHAVRYPKRHIFFFFNSPLDPLSKIKEGITTLISPSLMLEKGPGDELYFLFKFMLC